MTVPRRRKIILSSLFIGLGFLSFSGTTVEPDRSKIDPYISQAEESPAFFPEIGILAAPSRAGSPLLPVFIALRHPLDHFGQSVANLGGTSQRISDRLYVVHIPIESIRHISRLESVQYIEAGKRAQPMLDVSRPETLADDVQNGIGLPRGFTGSGINIGIVDTGLDSTHQDFLDNTGTTRVVRTYAAPFQDPGISLNPLVDEDGHGTHVAGIAAGNGFLSSGNYTGMAPEASLYIGKTNFRTTDIVVAVDNLMKTSAGPPVTPIAVNLSLGLMTGPHDGTDENHNPMGSLFTYGINDLGTNPPGGKGIIVVAAGNERNGREHFQITLPLFSSVETQIDNILVPPGRSFIEIDTWADGEDRYDVTVTMGSSTATVSSGNPGGSSGISVFNRTDTPPNGATHIMVFLSPAAETTTASIRFVRTRNGGTGRIDSYMDNYFNSSSNSFHNLFQTSTSLGTITEPANADNVIAVGSYNSKLGPFNFGSIGAISTFSSLGPTRDGRMKPDVAAPGSVIYSARSRDAFFNPWEIAANDNYAILAGTSMSAPHVTGIAALVWESNPALTGAQMRERLKKTADPPPGAPDNTWGHGKINALQAVQEPVAAISAPSIAVPLTPVALSASSSSGAFGTPLTYSWNLLSKPLGSGASLVSFLPQTSFTPDIPGDYTVSLSVFQGGFPPGTDIDYANIHVNNPPGVDNIIGPSSTDNVTPVVFAGLASDADSQALNFQWILLAKPPDSSPSFLPAGADNAILEPDLPGDYEIGLRVNDGMDNSALRAVMFTAGGFPITGRGGGGGGSCSVTPRENGENIPSTAAAIILLAFPLVYVCIRRPYII